jgi:hypothetical protein
MAWNSEIVKTMKKRKYYFIPHTHNFFAEDNFFVLVLFLPRYGSDKKYFLHIACKGSFKDPENKTPHNLNAEISEE